MVAICASFTILFDVVQSTRTTARYSRVRWWSWQSWDRKLHWQWQPHIVSWVLHDFADFGLPAHWNDFVSIAFVLCLGLWTGWVCLYDCGVYKVKWRAACNPIKIFTPMFSPVHSSSSSSSVAPIRPIRMPATANQFETIYVIWPVRRQCNNC